jgi:cyclic pyranopterin phosphate synthase
MVDITHKSNTLRQATAQAIVKVSLPATLTAIITKSVPKGDVFEMAKTAGLFAVKRTSDLIPDCHPLPIEYAAVRFELKEKELELHIQMEVKTIYKTGVEVEAMHGVSVVALTVYDMLKPIDKGIEICSIKLLEKKGGKSDTNKTPLPGLTSAVLVVSDSVSAGTQADKSGLLIVSRLEAIGLEKPQYAVVSDTVAEIQSALKKFMQQGIDLVITTGGTGLSPRDVTPEAVWPLLDREIPGIMEAARAYGQSRTPYAMLSRGVAGFAGNTLVLTLPGSPTGVSESLDAVWPHVLHVFQVVQGKRHE